MDRGLLFDQQPQQHAAGAGHTEESSSSTRDSVVALDVPTIGPLNMHHLGHPSERY